MNKSTLNKMLTRGFICGRVLKGDLEIPRTAISGDWVNWKASQGLPPEGFGFDTTDIMRDIAGEIDYEFVDDGKDAAGKSINPRLVKKI